MKPTEDERREARAWLGYCAESRSGSRVVQYARTTLAMLAERERMPHPMQLDRADYETMRRTYIATSSFHAVYEDMWNRYHPPAPRYASIEEEIREMGT